MYRKWDNIKHISEEIKERRRPRKAYASGLWGLKINTKERLQRRKEPLQFGVVVTLKEMNGVSRCVWHVAGWLISWILRISWMYMQRQMKILYSSNNVEKCI